MYMYRNIPNSIYYKKSIQIVYIYICIGIFLILCYEKRETNNIYMYMYWNIPIVLYIIKTAKQILFICIGIFLILGTSYML